MKQRLVGALVLLSGGVILWSLLFTGPAAYKVDRNTQIPEAPRVEMVPDVQPRKPERVPSAETPVVAQPEKAAEPATPPPPPPPPPRVDPESGLPEAWLIQVASFGKKENADKLVETLQDKKYKAYVNSSQVAGETVYRVLVGPYVSQSSANGDKQSIEKQLNLQALLIRFER